MTVRETPSRGGARCRKGWACLGNYVTSYAQSDYYAHGFTNTDQ